MGLFRPDERKPRRPQAAASLEQPTKLPKDVPYGRVNVAIYPNAGEAVITSKWARGLPVDRSRKDGGAKDPERCQREAVRRARVTMRRYCCEHRLRYMWTLTYADGEKDAGRVRRDVERLVKKIASDRRGRRFPYIFVLEHHKDGQRFHVHMAVPFFFKQKKLEKAWGKGWVFCTDMKSKGECSFAGARRAANYLTKYIAKTFEHSEFGRHRYERAQGFEPERRTISRHDMDDGQSYAEEAFGMRPAFVWSSAEVEVWDGPPTRALFFLGRAPSG